MSNSPAVPHQTPDAVERPSSLMANSVDAIETTKNAPARKPHGVNSCGEHGPLGECKRVKHSYACHATNKQTSTVCMITALLKYHTCPAAKAGSDEMRMPTHIQKLNIGGGTCRASIQIRKCCSLETSRAEQMLNTQGCPECHVLACHHALQDGMVGQSQNELWGRQFYPA